jgi:ATP-dependent helicase HrpB
VTGEAAADDALAGVLLALAYPDRIAQRRAGAADADAPAGRFLLRNGRGAALDATQPLARAPYLAVAELAGGPGEREPRIALAAPLTAAELEAHAAEQVEHADEIVWDAAAGAVRARAVERLGALVLRERPVAAPDTAGVTAALLGAVADAVRARGLDAALPWTDGARGLRQRVAFARAVEGEAAWPDWSDAALSTTLDRWLGPALVGARRWSDVEAVDLAAVLAGTLAWDRRTALDVLAPTHVTVPTGSRIRVDYADPAAPVLAVRLQELFGLADTPRVGRGAVALTLHLLSPAHRPVQVTRDLAGFWRSSYFDVRRDLRAATRATPGLRTRSRPSPPGAPNPGVPDLAGVHGALTADGNTPNASAPASKTARTRTAVRPRRRRPSRRATKARSSR